MRGRHQRCSTASAARPAATSSAASTAAAPGDGLGLRQHLVDQRLEDLQLQRQRALGGRGDLLLQLRQLDGGEAHRRGQGLAMDEGALAAGPSLAAWVGVTSMK